VSLARHGSGPGHTLRALASQVHPVFMLPALAAALFGAVLAGTVEQLVGTAHLVAVFCALYTAHVTDGYVDFFVRGEDDDHPLTRLGCRVALWLATGVFVVCTLFLVNAVDVVAALLTIPGWFIGYFHAPQLDTNPVTATTGYPLGIALALVGGYYVQVRTVGPAVLGLAAVVLVVLSGIKVIDDATDVTYDASIRKRTVAVVLGPTRARRLAYGLLAAGSVVVVALALALPEMPPSAGLAVVPFGAVALVSRRADAELATMLLIRGSYLFLAVLVAAVWFRPLG